MEISIDSIVKRETIFSEQKSSNVKIKKLTELDGEIILTLYSSIFAASPWFEQYRCADCGEQYGGKGETLQSLLVKNDSTCKSNSCSSEEGELNLVPFYEGTYFDKQEGKQVSRLGESIYLDALSQEGFQGVTALLNNQNIGFAWGYRLPNKRSPSVWFDKVQETLKEKGIDGSSLFYAAEVGVDPNFQKQGYGTILSQSRLLEAKNSGFLGVIFRTKNPKLLSVYSSLFGEDNVQELFNDPNPSKEGVKWYSCSFENLR